MKFQYYRGFMFLDYNYKESLLNLLFSKVYIWDLGFGIEVWLIPFGIMQSKLKINFQYIFSQQRKVEFFLWKHSLYILKYLFSRNSYVCPIWIFIFDTDQSQINSVLYHIFALQKVIFICELLPCCLPPSSAGPWVEDPGFSPPP